MPGFALTYEQLKQLSETTEVRDAVHALCDAIAVMDRKQAYRQDQVAFDRRQAVIDYYRNQCIALTARIFREFSDVKSTAEDLVGSADNPRSHAMDRLEQLLQQRLNAQTAFDSAVECRDYYRNLCEQIAEKLKAEFPENTTPTAALIGSPRTRPGLLAIWFKDALDKRGRKHNDAPLLAVSQSLQQAVADKERLALLCEHEKDRRSYYQDTLNAICNAVDWRRDVPAPSGQEVPACISYGGHDEPSTQLQDRIEQLLRLAQPAPPSNAGNKEGWVFLHPGGRYECAHFDRTVWTTNEDDHREPTTIEHWRDVYRHGCEIKRMRLVLVDIPKAPEGSCEATTGG